MKPYKQFISELRQSRKISADEAAFREYWVKAPNWSPDTQGQWQKIPTTCKGFCDSCRNDGMEGCI